MSRIYGGDSEMILLRGKHKFASFTLVEGAVCPLIQIKFAARPIAMRLRQHSI